jgi:hypothetical protein
MSEPAQCRVVCRVRFFRRRLFLLRRSLLLWLLLLRALELLHSVGEWCVALRILLWRSLLLAD